MKFRKPKQLALFGGLDPRNRDVAEFLKFRKRERAFSPDVDKVEETFRRWIGQEKAHYQNRFFAEMVGEKAPEAPNFTFPKKRNLRDRLRYNKRLRERYERWISETEIHDMSHRLEVEEIGGRISRRLEAERTDIEGRLAANAPKQLSFPKSEMDTWPKNLENERTYSAELDRRAHDRRMAAFSRNQAQINKYQTRLHFTPFDRPNPAVGSRYIPRPASNTQNQIEAIELGDFDVDEWMEEVSTQGGFGSGWKGIKAAIPLATRRKHFGRTGWTHSVPTERELAKLPAEQRRRRINKAKAIDEYYHFDMAYEGAKRRNRSIGRIDGLGEEGMAKQSRNSFFDGSNGDRGFGSGWRGLFKKVFAWKSARRTLRDLQSRFEGEKIWELSREQFIKNIEQGKYIGFSFEAVDKNFGADILAQARAKGITAPGLQEVVEKTVTGKGEIRHIFFNDPRGNPIVSSTIAKFPGSEEYMLMNLAKDVSLPREITREAVDVVMRARFAHGAFEPSTFTQGSASAYHRAAQNLAIEAGMGQQIKKEMLKSTMKTRVTESGYTTGLLGKRPGGSRGSRRMPSGGNG